MKPEQFVLRWFSGEEGFNYRNIVHGLVTSQREATRFSSAHEARASVKCPWLLFGSDGPTDKVGWKAVRLVPKKSSS